MDRFRLRLRNGAEIAITGTSTVTPAPIDDDYLPIAIKLPVPANALLLPGGHSCEVTGESHHLDTFEAAFGPRRREGARMGTEVIATLATDPSNPYDRNAVIVMLGGRQCGYLPRQTAEVLSPILAKIEATGRIPACRAVVTGGWDRGGEDQGDYGVRLNLADPEVLLKAMP